MDRTTTDFVPQSTIDHFKAIPWCSAHFSDPAFHIVNISRTITKPGHADSLICATWNTAETIPEVLSLFRPPDTTTGLRGELRKFHTFGTGLNGHANLLHGGVIATMLDTVMGNCVNLEALEGTPYFTVALNITYKKTITAPGTILGRSWIIKKDGRKMWVHGVLESSGGQVCASAEGMWLMQKAKL